MKLPNYFKVKWRLFRILWTINQSPMFNVLIIASNIKKHIIVHSCIQSVSNRVSHFFRAEDRKLSCHYHTFKTKSLTFFVYYNAICWTIYCAMSASRSNVLRVCIVYTLTFVACMCMSVCVSLVCLSVFYAAIEICRWIKLINIYLAVKPTTDLAVVKKFGSGDFFSLSVTMNRFITVNWRLFVSSCLYRQRLFCWCYWSLFQPNMCSPSHRRRRSLIICSGIAVIWFVSQPRVRIRFFLVLSRIRSWPVSLRNRALNCKKA